MKKKTMISVICAALFAALFILAGCGGGGEAANDPGIEDGTYVVDFKTDHAMFHVNDANNDKGIPALKDLSFEAWRYSEEVNEEQRAAAKAESEKGAAVADEDVETTHYWIYSPGDGAA